MATQSLTALAGELQGEVKSEAAGARTQDLRIKSPLLYQLSYSFISPLDHHQRGGSLRPLLDRKTTN